VVVPGQFPFQRACSRARCCTSRLSKIASKTRWGARGGKVALVGCIERFINPIVLRFLLVTNLSEEDIRPERRADENVDGDAQFDIAFRTGMRKMKNRKHKNE
jgi:hypothetical protein